MTPDAPEFHTKTLSPVSPLPVHPILPFEESTIPVLQNQIDPIFNMTSTHLEPDSTRPVVNVGAESALELAEAKEGSPSAHSSFSDAYKDNAEVAIKKDVVDNTQLSDEDDYAMTFDSEGEETADSQDISKANTEPETNSLPTAVLDDTTSALATHELPTTDLPTTNVPTDTSNLSHVGQSGDDTIVDTSEAQTTQHPAEADSSSSQNAYEDITNGGIDIQQLLDNITANAEKNAAATLTTTGPTSHTPSPSLPMNNAGLPPHSSLPPRPNLPLKRPYPDETHSVYAGAPGLPPASTSFRAPGSATAIVAAGAPGTSTDPRGGLPPPPGVSFRGPPPTLSNPMSSTPSVYQQDIKSSGLDKARSIGSHDADDLDSKWGPDIQRLYDSFLEDERHYVTEGLWDRFPLGSRLFIGNLPSESVTKRDLFHVFHHYGRIAQISIKQAYGFVQYHDSAACHAALEREQGAEVRGRKIHLEISKPQKNTRNGDHGDRSQRQKGSSHAGRDRGNDRFESRPSPPVRNDEYGRPIRGRDDYRPVRQPSPPRPNFRGRDEYTPRGRDSYDGRDRRLDRSRSPPYGYREEPRYRERSLSPRAREALEDADLQIPRRDPHNIPDVQLIIMDQLDRQFVSWVENEIRVRGIKVEVMFLSPRLPIQAVIRRQILEGVHAVSKLDMRSQHSSKIPLQVFDRQGGANNVRFDEYQDLDPKIAAELVVRAKQTQIPPHTPSYAQPQYPVSQAYQTQAPAPAPAAPNLANLVGSLDNATLQKLLGTLSAVPPQQQQQQNTAVGGLNSGIDLAGLLGGLKNQAAPPQNYMPAHQAADPYASIMSNPALASLLGGTAQQPQHPTISQPQESAQQVQNIMAQLARFRQ